MTVMSIRIDDVTRKTLKLIAAIEGKSMGSIVSGLIEDYIKENIQKVQTLSEKDNLHNIMKLSENSFMEWDNDEEEIYNEL
ncbi:MAG: hypothetical protein PF503_19135 [Desulfobacula sp.]|jgi:hypothetical protein|nr:hypothetical protein [Desulfobacula sp.]